MNKFTRPQSILTTKEAICDWLTQMKIKHYSINEDLTVDVSYSIDLRNNDFTILPVQFGQVSGNFDVSDTSLKTLKGCPKKVFGNLYAESIPIKNLLQLNSTIIGSLYLSGNKKMESLLNNENLIVNKIYSNLSLSNIQYQQIKNIEAQELILNVDAFEKSNFFTQYHNIYTINNTKVHINFSKLKEILKTEDEKSFLESNIYHSLTNKKPKLKL